MKTMSKWAVGQPMIEWCERNGLDATRIPDRPDAITTERRMGVIFATVRMLVLEDDDSREVRRVCSDAASTSLINDRIEATHVVPVDSEPPLNPEWERLFGGEFERAWLKEWTP